MLHLKSRASILWPLLTIAACSGSTQTGMGGSSSDGGGGGGGASNSGGGAAGDSANGASGSGTNGAGASGSGTTGSGFIGSGTGFAGNPLPPGLGPDTKDECPTPPPLGTSTQVKSSATTCFYGDTLHPDVPAATIEQVIEVVDGKEVVHIRVTFNPTFVDNTYGDTAVGWGTPTTTTAGTGGATTMPGGMMPGGMMPGMPKPPKGTKGGHTFKDLVGSDHVELELFNGDKTVSFQGDVDYISEDSSSPCGYGTLGVTGGEGKVIVGSASDVLAVATSLDRDLNGCGYCQIESSPATDASYTPSTDAPKWDYRVVYELWLDAAAFGASGFGYAVIREVHASPSKIPGTNTVTVTPKPCPPGWDVPHCLPSQSGEGIECGGGTGGTGNVPDGGGICPEGTVPDLASEGKFCVPI